MHKQREHIHKSWLVEDNLGGRYVYYDDFICFVKEDLLWEV